LLSSHSYICLSVLLSLDHRAVTVRTERYAIVIEVLPAYSYENTFHLSVYQHSWSLFFRYGQNWKSKCLCQTDQYHLIHSWFLVQISLILVTAFMPHIQWNFLTCFDLLAFYEEVHIIQNYSVCTEVWYLQY
jgi:hypothetical protein